ncbi:MAG: FeoB-associated Cys-rich membrane protein [Clostridia bacterium]|nr:FeoB-associated Cys-rich membrane protein [Clostridia bacterium]
MIENVILIAVIVVILALAGGYVYKAKKSGNKCIGCPHSSICGSENCNCNKK